ncbi:putative hydrolase [Chitinispirillum alkaliphilum]|nr:putative hydrolase [Chitinispirillum alkaliphilum]
MIEFDLHVHSLFSKCGLHTFLELIEQAHKLGMKGIAITDHGPALGGRLNSPFFERFCSPYSDLKLLKGIECNVLNSEGEIDVPRDLLKFLDVVLLGIHPNIKPGENLGDCTDMLIAAMEKNPCIDIITHPNDPAYKVDYQSLAREAKKHGIAVELNNSKLMYNRSSAEDVTKLIEACRDAGCYMAVNSDTHAIHELGCDDHVRGLLREANFRGELIVNRTEQSTLEFVNGRIETKRC